MERPTIWKCIILFALGFLLYGNTLTHDYALDDYIVITGNSFTKQGIDGIQDILTHDAFEGTYGKALDLTGGRYRPLSIVMFALEYEWFGPDPFYGHLINVLLYVLTGVVIFIFLKVILPKENIWVPFIIAGLFVVHPIHTEVVANIKSRDEILSLLLSFVALMGALSNRVWIGVFLGPLLFFLALLSKENAITFLAIIPITLFFFSKKPIGKILINTLPYVVVVIGYLCVRSTFAGIVGDRETTDIMDDPYLIANWNEKYSTIIYTIGKYIELLLAPFTLSSDYSFNQVPLITWGTFKAIFSSLTILSLFLYAIIKTKKRSVISYGIFFFFITFSIVSNVFFNVGTSMAERFIYMPSVGFSIVVGVLISRITGLSRLGQSPNWLKVGICILIIALPFSYKTIARNKVWKNNFVLYKEDVNNAPNSARIHLYYGIELMGRYNKTNQINILHQAKEEIKKAIQINPDFFHGHYNLAVAYEKNGEIDAAIQSHKRVLEIQPQHIKSTLSLGLLYGNVKKEYARSVTYFNMLLNSNYKEATLFDNLGVAHAMLGDFTSAAASFEKGVSYHPNNARLHFNLAITYDNLGFKDQADKHYEQAFSINPDLRKDH